MTMNHDERHALEDFGRCAVICLGVILITAVLAIGAYLL